MVEQLKNSIVPMGPPILETPTPVGYNAVNNSAAFFPPFSQWGQQAYYLNRNLNVGFDRMRNIANTYSCYRVVSTAVHLQFIVSWF